MNSECNRASPGYRRIHRGERQCRKGLRVHRTKVELMRYPPLRHEKQPPSQGRRLTMNGKKNSKRATVAARHRAQGRVLHLQFCAPDAPVARAAEGLQRVPNPCSKTGTETP